MATADIQAPAFTDDNVAREAIEALMWPHGPACAHCGSLDTIGKAKGKPARPAPDAGAARTSFNRSGGRAPRTPCLRALSAAAPLVHSTSRIHRRLKFCPS